MSWPSRSPDLNPVENLLAVLSAKLYENARQFDTIDDLKKAMLTAWENTSNILKLLCNLMPDRLTKFIAKRGGITQYV